MTDTEQSLLDSVCRYPADDLPRLIYADEIEPHDPERAEFIRVQIELANRRNLMCDRCNNIIDKRAGSTLRCRGDVCSLRRREYESSKRFIVWEWLGGVGSQWPHVFSSDSWERGFPSRASMTLEQFIGGGECRSCRPFALLLGVTAIEFCYICHGSGRIPGLADTLAKRWPITSVAISDKSPSPYGVVYAPERWGWFRLVADDHEATIPNELWRLMGGHIVYSSTPHSIKWYESPAAARSALSDAAVDYARDRAGLPPLNRVTRPASAK